jgi:hypothetical protein
VGISKKTLDDYYIQLRLAEQYGFNFFRNLHHKMRVLRSYIKVYKPKKETKSPFHEKHPRNLKILNYYDLHTHTLSNVGESTGSVKELSVTTMDQNHESEELFSR